MIWLFLFALLVAVLGVAVVLLDWSRGIRRGFLVPLVVFSAAGYVAVNVISWIAVVDAGGELRQAEVPPSVVDGGLSGGSGAGRAGAPLKTEPPLWSLSGWSRSDYLALANVVVGSLPTVWMLFGFRGRADAPRYR